MPENALHPWYAIHEINELDSPAFVIYLERVKQNIRSAIEMVGDAGRLRPHVKTHKSADVTRLMLQAGITKFKCATIAEAEMLAMAGAPDVLLAYQPVGPKAIRFITLKLQYPSTRFSCLIDDAEAAATFGAAAAKQGVEIPVFIDLNVGMNRTGITPGSNAVDLFKQVAEINGLMPAGLHVYDGHISAPDLAQRTTQCNEAFDQVEKVKDELRQKSFENITVVAGGSTTFPVHAKRKEVECSPGTFVYWDYGYLEAFPEQPFQPAALVISRVISHPGDGLLCVDLGHKSVAAENPLQRRVRFVNAMELEFVSQSEEHLVLKNNGNRTFIVGDVLYGMPVHVCPTCALYERAYVVENGNVIAEWKTVARDRKITL